MENIEIENKKYKIRCWLAEFADPEIEQTFQKYTQRANIRQLGFVLITWALLLLLFAVPDYIQLGPAPSFFYLLTYRVVMILMLLVLFFVITPDTSIFRVSYPVSAAVIAGFSGFMLFFIYRSDATDLVIGIIAIMIICLLMFFPIRFIFLFCTAIYAVLITIMTRYVLGTSIVRLIALFLIFMLPVVVGAANAVRIGVLQRRQFAMLIKERLAADALAKSEKSLVDAQARAHLGNWSLDYINRKIFWSEEMFRLSGLDIEDGPPESIEKFVGMVYHDDKEVIVDVEDKILKGKESLKSEYRVIRCNDSTIRWVESHFDPVLNEDGNLIGVEGTALDITDRKVAEEQIKALLNEKEVLLTEVHHRVKNNMNIMMSLLSLQADSVNDSTASSVLYDAMTRMKSMGVLYDRLYRSESFNEMSVRGYLMQLLGDIMATFPMSRKISIIKNIDDVILHYSILSPIGIMTNEILTNAIKHAFKGRDSGEIKVSFSVEGSRACYAIEDNGIGISESVDLQEYGGFGLQLIDMMARQINGKLTIERNNGSKIKVVFEV